jgi:Family of unknown function (DUF5677)
VRARKHKRPTGRLWPAVESIVLKLANDGDFDLESAEDWERIAKGVSEALDAAGGLLSTTLLAAAPAMLEEQRQIRAGFEARLAWRWRKPFDLFDVVARICLELGEEEAKDARRRRLAGAQLEALLRLQARACLLTAEIRSLLHAGHASGAMARWRSLHDVSVVAGFLYASPNDVAERFLLHYEATRVRELKALQAAAPRLHQGTRASWAVADAARRRDLLRAAYGDDYGESDYDWAADALHNKRPKLTDLEERVNLDHWRPYVQIAHRTIHAGPAGLYGDIGAPDPNAMMLAGPSDTGLGDPAQATIIALQNVTTALLLLDRPEINLDPVWALRALSAIVDQALDAFAEVEGRQELLMAGRRRPPRQAGRSRRRRRMAVPLPR